MDDSILISVIVPVFNAEKYLSTCIESIISQDYKNIEILLIDDGSRDNSGKICDKYQMMDSRIKVFHRNNHGVGATRNYGIDVCNGKYIVFVDSDDICANKLVSSLVNDIAEADICIGSIKLLNNYNTSKELVLQNRLYDYKRFVDEVLSIHQTSQLVGAPYAKLFVAKIIKDNSIRYNEDMNFGEDFCFSMNYLHFCKKIRCSSKLVYSYRENNVGSLTYNNFRKTSPHTIWRQRLMVYDKWKDAFKYSGLYDENVIKVTNLLLEYTISTIKLACKQRNTKNHQIINIIQDICNASVIESDLRFSKPENKMDNLRKYLIKNKHTKVLYILETMRYSIGRLIKKVD